MLESTRRDHFRALLDARKLAGVHGNHSEEYVRHICELAYGKSISQRSWKRWKERALVCLDSPLGNHLSEASFVALWTMAGLLRGNKQHRPRNQVSRKRLAEAMVAIINGAPKSIPEPPENISYEELHRLVELQAMRSYSDRYHRMQGLKKGQLFYSRCEALQIMSKYPNHRINHVEFKVG